LQVTKATYSGLQEHRIIVYTVAANKGKAKATYEHGNHRYRTFKQNTRSATCSRDAEEHDEKQQQWSMHGAAAAGFYLQCLFLGKLVQRGTEGATVGSPVGRLQATTVGQQLCLGPRKLSSMRSAQNPPTHAWPSTTARKDGSEKSAVNGVESLGNVQQDHGPTLSPFTRSVLPPRGQRETLPPTSAPVLHHHPSDPHAHRPLLSAAATALRCCSPPTTPPETSRQPTAATQHIPMRPNRAFRIWLSE
jgi:hypothetical protein